MPAMQRQKRSCSKRPQPPARSIHALLAIVVLSVISDATAQAQAERPDEAANTSVPKAGLPLQLHTGQSPDQPPVPPLLGSSWRFDSSVGAPGQCATCPGDTIAPPLVANAPWTLNSRVTYSAPGHTQLTLGVIGNRNDRLPTFMTQTIGGAGETTLPLWSLADMSRRATDWQLTAGAQHTVKRFGHGQTIGVAGDVFIPLSSGVSPSTAGDIPVLPSKALRVGIVLGF